MTQISLLNSYEFSGDESINQIVGSFSVQQDTVVMIFKIMSADTDWERLVQPFYNWRLNSENHICKP